MTNAEKSELISMIKQGYDIEEIMEVVSCCRSTIKRYIKAFSKRRVKPKKERQ